MAKHRAGYVLSEFFWGLLLSILVFAISFLMSEFGIWVFLQWQVSERTLYLVFVILNLVSSLTLLSIPMYNERYIQLFSATVFLIAYWYLALFRFNFHPVYTLFKMPAYPLS